MLFPFRTTTIFRNRWVALLWAGGVILMASEIVDSVSGLTTNGPKSAARSAPASHSGDDPLARAPDSTAAIDTASAPPIAGTVR